MSISDNAMNHEALSPGELHMLFQTLDVWCSDRKIDRKAAEPHATLLLATYRSGKRSQIDLLQALDKMG